MKLKITIGVVILIKLSIIAQLSTPFMETKAQTDGNDSDPDRWAILYTLHRQTMPALNVDFVQKTEVLNRAITNFEQEPTLDNLETMQTEWLEAVVAWERITILGIGRVMFTYNRINSHPDEEKLVGYLSGDDDLTPEFVGSIGSNARGLGSIEYLIFPGEGDNELVLETLQNNPRHMQYLVSLGLDLQTNAEQIQVGWVSESESFGTEPTANQIALSTEEMALRDMANELVGSLENIPRYRLGRPMGTTSEGEPRPDLVQAWRSNTSIVQMVANLEGFKIIFNGDTGEINGFGFADYLNSLGAEFEGEPLADVINNQIDVCITALNAIEQPLQIAIFENPEQVNTAFQELNTLVRLYKADALSEMSIAQTFTDNDGD